MKKIYISILLILAFVFRFEGNKIFAFNQNSIQMTETEEETKISISENRLVIENLKQDSILEVYSIVGVKVYSIKIKAGTNEYPLNLPKGYYIIRIDNITKKIALR
mgnify:CR=1 FL=1